MGRRGRREKAADEVGAGRHSGSSRVPKHTCSTWSVPWTFSGFDEVVL